MRHLHCRYFPAVVVSICDKMPFRHLRHCSSHSNLGDEIGEGPKCTTVKRKIHGCAAGALLPNPILQVQHANHGVQNANAPTFSLSCNQSIFGQNLLPLFFVSIFFLTLHESSFSDLQIQRFWFNMVNFSMAFALRTSLLIILD
jgi:hypothetical protein